MLRLSVIAFSALSIIYACSRPVAPNLDPATSADAALDRQAKRDGESSSGFRPPQVLATLQEPAVNESSGIAASRLDPGLFWTHNDSGDDPFIYAFDREGKRRGVWRVRQAEARDWED